MTAAWAVAARTSTSLCVSGKLVRLDSVKQFKDGHAQRIGDDFDGVEGGIGFAVFDAAEVGLIKTTHLPELDLAETGANTQLTHTGSEQF